MAHKHEARRQAMYRAVEAELGGKVLCDRCGATLETFADACTAALGAPCPGFVAIDNAKMKAARMTLKERPAHD